METTTRKYTINDVGCYIDGHVGIYQGEQVQELASSHGMDVVPIGPNKPDDCDATEGQWADMYTYYTDEALEWLNEHMVDTDVFFEFYEGEFFLSSIVQREEEENFLV